MADGVRRRRYRAAANALLSFAAGAAIAFAVGGSRARSPTPEPTSAGDAELKRERIALAAMRSENSALRQELDRLRLLVVPGAPASADPTPPKSAADTAEHAAERLSGLAGDYRAAVERLVAGNAAAEDDTYQAVIRLLRAGPAAFPPLRDTYLSTADPRAREVMIRAIIHGHGNEAEEFLASQIGTETDPGLRRALVEHAAMMSGPATASIFRGPFLQALVSDSDADERAAAVDGLRYLRDDPQISQALLAAASDRSEDVRLAAFAALASSRDLRDSLREILARDPSERVQQIGECRLLLADRAP